MSNPYDKTLRGMFEKMDELGAGQMSLVARKKDGEAVTAVVFLSGKGTQEILDAVDEIYERQDREARED